MSEDVSLALGLTFGGLVTAILRSGISEDELRRWLESALGTYRTVNGDPPR